MPPDQLATENMLFERHREEWLKSHLGAFVAIQGEAIADGFFSSYAEAFRAGLKKFGVRQAFLVKQVWVTEPAYFVS